jgi:hypothetical protein
LYLENTDSHEIPASWADRERVDIDTNGFFNGANGYSNGHNNGEKGKALTKVFLDGKSVRTVYGLVPLQYALDWPVFASYDELAGCAAYMGGRIPTVEEARSIYSHVDRSKLKQAEQHLGKTVPAVNG